MLQLAFDKTNNLVSIYDVDTGTDCNCKCSCGEPLIAKNKGKSKDKLLLPKQKDAHFAHKGDCGETDIHLLAKETLKQSKKLRIYYYKKEDDCLVLKPEIKDYGSVVTEEYYPNKNGIVIRPDVILWEKTDTTLEKDRNNISLFVEFKYTHEVDEQKKEKLKKIGIKTLEIDLTLNEINPIKEDGTPNFSEMQTFLENYEEMECDWVLNNEHDELFKWNKEEVEKAKRVERNRVPTFIGQQSEELRINKDYKKIEDPQKLQNWGESMKAKGWINRGLFGRYDKFVRCPMNDQNILLAECKGCPDNYNGKTNSVHPENEYAIFCKYGRKIKN